MNALPQIVLVDDRECRRRQGARLSTFSLARASGRKKNIFRTPDGRKTLPAPAPQSILELDLPHFKLVQRALTDIEFTYVPSDPMAVVYQEPGRELVDNASLPVSA